MDTNKFTAVVGKQIVGVVLKESADGKRPYSQVFFEFADGTYFELHSDSSIQPTQLGPGGTVEVLRYMGETHRVLFQTSVTGGA